jgi:hypothetical protein
MEILPLEEAQTQPGDLVVREARLSHLLMTGLLGALGLGWLVLAWRLPLAGLGVIAGLVLGLPCLAVAAALAEPLMRAFGRPGWILALGERGLTVAPRSFLNAGSAAPAWAVRLAWDELEHARELHERRELPGPDPGDRQLRRLTWLELGLRAPLPAELRARLESERTVGSFRHLPLALSPSGERGLRLSWNGLGTRLRPALPRVLERLAPHVDVQPASSTERPAWDAARGRELEDLVLELARTGQTLQAVRVVRERYGWDLTRAKAFVDELAGRPAA